MDGWIGSEYVPLGMAEQRQVGHQESCVVGLEEDSLICNSDILSWERCEKQKP